MEKKRKSVFGFFNHEHKHNEVELRKLILEGYKTVGIVGKYFLMKNSKTGNTVLYNIKTDTYSKSDY